MTITLRCGRGASLPGWPASLACLLVALFACPRLPARAATKAGAESAVRELVDEALFSEVYALDQGRSRLLGEALQRSPNFAPARWHSGHVRLAGKWVHVDDVVSSTQSDDRYQEYQRLRLQHGDKAEDHLELGIWCERRRLKEQARAHFLSVLEMSPDDPEARTRLGYRRVKGTWLTRNEIRRADADSRRAERARAQWEPKLLRIHYGLQHRSEKEQQKARARGLAIEDPAAIPAIESVLAASREEGALLAVEVLGNITDHEASLPLARQAVSSEWEAVRSVAAEKLKYRPLETFVPAMLAVMHTPFQSRDEFERRPNGALLHRQIISREGQTVRQERIFETTYNVPLARAKPAAEASSRQRQDAVAEPNIRSEEVNRRISLALNVATGQDLSSQPEDWWKWWDDYNETLADEKPVQRTYSRETYGPPPPPRHYSCFAAGTPVWTIAGPRPIERLRIGDLVLSQDPETGQLAYKAVLRTTVAPPQELVKVRAGGETFDCTGGHLFWVSGKGWVRARKVLAGDVFHGATGTAVAGTVETGPTQRAHNLVVADFNTYFVGQQKILVHDVTLRRPTTTVVPGLKQQ